MLEQELVEQMLLPMVQASNRAEGYAVAITLSRVSTGTLRPLGPKA
jgi:hypothetical protein